jgi:uncharacterized protein YdeI (YjbR/CyaY-like superfamily)
MKTKNAGVDAFLDRAGQWKEELTMLREILLECGLTEEVKWSQPCYTFEGNNVIVIHGFKAYCAMLFLKGVLLSDPERILKKTGENTRVGRQMRFTHVSEIAELKSIIKDYIKEAIELEREGVKVAPEEKTALKLPVEFQRKLKEMPALKAAFEKLTPGRQRGYAFYFSGAKQPATRESRIEKCVPMIMEGRGFYDK